jgi:hypothetical protein
VPVAIHGSRQVWLRRLTDGSQALLFLNTGPRTATLAIPASRLGLGHRRYRVLSLWRHRSWISSAPTIAAKVYPDDVVMLRLWPVR